MATSRWIGSSESSSAWVQIGTAAFNPLLATVESGGALANDAAVAAYTAGNTARGESPAWWRPPSREARAIACT